MSWSPTPPTEKEWLDVESHGMWWVKFILSEREEEIDPEDGKKYYWPEVWHVDCVQICSEWSNDGDHSKDRLVARGFVLQQFYLDDPEATKGLFWQPVKTPDDDVKR